MGNQKEECIQKNGQEVTFRLPHRDQQLSLEQLRGLYQESSYTMEGEKYQYSTLGEQLTSKVECDFPPEAETLEKASTCCIDEGLFHDNPGKRVVAISGSGVGEDDKILDAIIPDDASIRSHEICGKATLVLAKKRAALGKPEPTLDEVNIFAQTGAAILAVSIGRKLGDMQRYDSGRRTQMVRPKDFHPANGAVINLSERFLHNLIEQDDLLTTPWKFKLEGTYLGALVKRDSELLKKINPESHEAAQKELLEFVANEYLLPVEIASSSHGVGKVDRGFTYTFLVDMTDSQYEDKLTAATIVSNHINSTRDLKMISGSELSPVEFEVIGYNISTETKKVNFNRIA